MFSFGRWISFANLKGGIIDVWGHGDVVEKEMMMVVIKCLVVASCVDKNACGKS